MPKCDRLVDVGRRQFLRGGAVAAAGAAAASVAPSAPAAARARVDYPSNRLANVSELTTNEPFDISYPDADSPGVLIKLGQRVPGGAGPDGDIVAYSVLCPHKGYQLVYHGADKTLNCPGHYSRFDAEMEGQQIFGMANQSLPKFDLRVDANGDIFAEGVDELIYGRTSNVLQG
ncbi:arsenate reductase (azurin) small subunit [Pelagibius sp.]|uniref:arsenate reductase (azurin) small subunit n=1 Tax=Pelagibius sp. TaxID=1931238 RepID=UPI00262D5503|nr:arsenate reductase (azurin) small subunit [Pelagibius sp.]